MKKLTFQTVLLAIIFVNMNDHTFKLFRNGPNDIQTKGNGEIPYIRIYFLIL